MSYLNQAPLIVNVTSTRPLSPAAAQRRCPAGFDIRVSRMSGALGAGCYFARDLSYSLDYVHRVTPCCGCLTTTCFHPCQARSRPSRGLFAPILLPRTLLVANVCHRNLHVARQCWMLCCIGSANLSVATGLIAIFFL